MLDRTFIWDWLIELLSGADWLNFYPGLIDRTFIWGWLIELLFWTDWLNFYLGMIDWTFFWGWLIEIFFSGADWFNFYQGLIDVENNPLDCGCDVKWIVIDLEVPYTKYIQSNKFFLYIYCDYKHKYCSGYPGFPQCSVRKWNKSIWGHGPNLITFSFFSFNPFPFFPSSLSINMRIFLKHSLQNNIIICQLRVHK